MSSPDALPDELRGLRVLMVGYDYLEAIELGERLADGGAEIVAMVRYISEAGTFTGARGSLDLALLDEGRRDELATLAHGLASRGVPVVFRHAANGAGLS